MVKRIKPYGSLWTLIAVGVYGTEAAGIYRCSENGHPEMVNDFNARMPQNSCAALIPLLKGFFIIAGFWTFIVTLLGFFPILTTMSLLMTGEFFALAGSIFTPVNGLSFSYGAYSIFFGVLYAFSGVVCFLLTSVGLAEAYKHFVHERLLTGIAWVLSPVTKVYKRLGMEYRYWRKGRKIQKELKRERKQRQKQQKRGERTSTSDARELLQGLKDIFGKLCVPFEYESPNNNEDDKGD